jgi:hypothetical protein
MSPLLIVVEGDASDVASFITPLGLKAQVYADVTSALGKEYGISICPCYFRLDNDLRITGFGPLKQNPEDVIGLAHAR